MDETFTQKRYEYHFFFCQFSESLVLNFLRTYDDYFLIKYNKDNTIFAQINCDYKLTIPNNIKGFTYLLQDCYTEKYLKIEDFDIMADIEILKHFSKN